MTNLPDKKFFVIVADDDIDDQHLIKQALLETGFNCEVTSVYNGLQLMDFLLKREVYKNLEGLMPDLILLDINMPLMNGFGVLEQMCDHGLIEQIPVYMLSTSSSQADKKHAMELRARDYYVKPINYQQLKSTLHEICEKELVFGHT